MMIRSDCEWRESQERLIDFREQVRQIREELVRRGLDQDAIGIATAPQETMAEDIAWEIALYERMKAGDLEAIPNYSPPERGKALICLRIVKGWSQRQLAEALTVSEGVVSRDERNEYHGISLEKFGKVLMALGFQDQSRFIKVPHAQWPQRPTVSIAYPVIHHMAGSFIPDESIKLPTVKEG
jgi:hypothetical protein